MMGWLLSWLQAPEWALVGGLVLAVLLVWLAVAALRDLAEQWP